MRPSCNPDQVRMANDLLRKTLYSAAARPAFTLLPQPIQQALCAQMQRSPVFDTKLDPDGERSAGYAHVGGYTMSWRILYYDGRLPGYAGVSPNPADPKVTRRVLLLDCVTTPVEADQV